MGQKGGLSSPKGRAEGGGLSFLLAEVFGDHTRFTPGHQLGGEGCAGEGEPQVATTSSSLSMTATPEPSAGDVPMSPLLAVSAQSLREEAGLRS